MLPLPVRRPTDMTSRPAALSFASMGAALLAGVAGCGSSDTSTGPSKSEAPPASSSAAGKPATSGAAAGSASADLTFTGVIDGHITTAQPAPPKIDGLSCDVGRIRAAVTVSGKNYIVEALNYDHSSGETKVGNGHNHTTVVSLTGTGVDDFEAISGTATLTSSKSATLDVNLAGRFGSDKKVHVAGNVSCS
ncbi:MAG: hypothetical protein NVSMB29_12140 [Candidatus Dormibacteria bacterium]